MKCQQRSYWEVLSELLGDEGPTTSLLMSEDHRTRTLMSPALFLIAKERQKAEVAWSNASPFLCEFFDPGTQLANKFGDLIVAARDSQRPRCC